MNTSKQKHPVAKRSTQRQQLDAAINHLAYRKMLLQAHESLWQSDWESAANPFEAVAQYRLDRPQRLPIINAWLSAHQACQRLRDEVASREH